MPTIVWACALQSSSAIPQLRKLFYYNVYLFQLCVIALVNLNCKDVMFWLIFRHRIPLKHLLASQKGSIRQADLHGRTAEKLLLSPA